MVEAERVTKSCPALALAPCDTPDQCRGAGHCINWTDPPPLDLKAAAREQELPDLLNRARIILINRDQNLREVALLRVIKWFLDGLETP